MNHIITIIVLPPAVVFTAIIMLLPPAVPLTAPTTLLPPSLDHVYKSQNHMIVKCQNRAREDESWTKLFKLCRISGRCYWKEAFSFGYLTVRPPKTIIISKILLNHLLIRILFNILITVFAVFILESLGSVAERFDAIKKALLWNAR